LKTAVCDAAIRGIAVLDTCHEDPRRRRNSSPRRQEFSARRSPPAPATPPRPRHAPTPSPIAERNRPQQLLRWRHPRREQHMLRGMATLIIWADDVEAAGRWYAGLLGTEPYFERPGGGRPPAYLEFRIGDHQAELGI